MQVRVLDLDGSITLQRRLLLRHRPEVVPLSKWGPRVRMACRWGRFAKFEKALHRRLQVEGVGTPRLNFCGSGDFHHVSLALLRRLHEPVNLLVVDKHPDWMRGVPILHCGTWLYHAARLPLVQRIFHVGGETDFDNGYRWLAPTGLLHSGRLTVFPACRRFNGRLWDRTEHEPIRASLNGVFNARRLDRLIAPHRAALASWPLYISLDKDVLVASEAPVNWDSGHLMFDELRRILAAFCDAAGGRVAGVDVVGDWSPVIVQGWLRAVLHRVEHPAIFFDPHLAAERNQALNLQLAEFFTHISPAACEPMSAAA